MRKPGVNRLLIASLLSTFVALLFGALAPARAEVGKGRFTLMPELAVEETFRSNVFLTESDRKSDLVTTVAPGIGFRYGSEANSVSVKYRVAFFNFARYSHNNYENHTAEGILRYSTPGGLRFDFTDDFTKGALEQSGVITRQRDFRQNLFSGNVGYEFSDRWRSEAKYARADLDFGSSLDRTSGYGSNLFGANLYYRFLPRVSALIEYDYLTKGFTGADIADHKDHLFYGGVAFSPRGKLKGSARAGYGQKEFDRRLASRNNSPDTWILAINLIDELNSKTRLSFDGTREMADDTDYSNASYINTVGSITFQHSFTGKIGVSGTVAYRQAEYLDRLIEPVTNATRRRFDTEWNLSAAGIYDMQKWLKMKIEYRYSDRNSNFNLYSYTDHRVIFTVVVAP